MLVKKRGFVRRGTHAEDAEVIIFEDEMVMWFLGEGNSDGSLGGECCGEQKREKNKQAFHERIVSQLDKPPRQRQELSRGPPGQNDEEDLHWNPQPKRCGRTPAKSYSSAGRVNVRGQHCDEKKNQRVARSASRRGDHKANRTGYLAKPGKENHRSRPWNPSRRHANEVFLHWREMRTRGEKKHDGEAIARSRRP